jgi:hypothetical protein
MSFALLGCGSIAKSELLSLWVQQSLVTMTHCVHFLWKPGLVVSRWWRVRALADVRCGKSELLIAFV